MRTDMCLGIKHLIHFRVEMTQTGEGVLTRFNLRRCCGRQRTFILSNPLVRSVSMNNVLITIAGQRFPSRFEAGAPETAAAFQRILPYRSRIIHVRWSGEACWIPMGERDLGLRAENATSYPTPGQVLIYPGGVSETEILIAYGPTHFASKAGTLAGNHVLSITEGLVALAVLGSRVLWDGAQEIGFELVADA